MPPPNFAEIDVEKLQFLECCQTMPQFPHSIKMFRVSMAPSNLVASCSNSRYNYTQQYGGERHERKENVG